MRNSTRIALFLSVISIFLYIANLVVYEALAAAFTIVNAKALLTLGLALGVLPAGFIAMMFLGSYFYNAWTRNVYWALAVYIGIFGYLFFASVAYGLILIGASYIVTTVVTEPLGMLLFAGAVLAGLYGVLHAKQIIPARYKVKLPNAPVEWHGRKALFISDLHLGQIYGPAFSAKVAGVVHKLQPDIIFIGGDLYDGTQAPDPFILAEPLKNMEAPLGVYYITGNHEEFGDNTVFLQAVRKLGITILRDEKVEIDGLQLVGVDYHNAHTTEGFKSILEKLSLDPAKPSLLLKHEPNHLSVAEEAGISLQLSGHTHYGQQWPFGLVAQLNYLGYAYGLKPFGAMQVLTSSGIGTWGPPLRLGSNSEAVVITFI